MFVFLFQYFSVLFFVYYFKIFITTLIEFYMKTRDFVFLIVDGPFNVRGVPIDTFKRSTILFFSLTYHVTMTLKRSISSWDTRYDNVRFVLTVAVFIGQIVRNYFTKMPFLNS
jgi:hypothetical protein